MFVNHLFSRYKFSVIVILGLCFYDCTNQKKQNVNSNTENEITYALIKVADEKDITKISKDVKLQQQVLKDNKLTEFKNENILKLNRFSKSVIDFDISKKLVSKKTKLKNISKSFISSMPESVQAKEMAAKQQNVESISYFDKLQGLKQSFVTSIYNDTYGNMWFGTHGGGVTRYDGKYFTHYTEKEGLAGNSVFCIRQLTNNKIWMGTYGKGISVFDGNNFENISTKDDFPSDYIYSILQDKKGRIWIGTQGGGLVMIKDSIDGEIYQYNTEIGFFSDNITTLMEDKIGNIWVGSEGNGFVKFDGENMMVPRDKFLSSSIVTEMVEDAQGNIWITTYGSGLFQIKDQNILQYNEKSGFPSDMLSSVKVDQSANIWVGSDGKGVVKIRGTNADSYEFKLINELTGLSNDNVYSIAEDKSETMWFGTNRGGVNKYNGNKFLHILDANVFSFTEDKDKNVWISTNDGGIIKYVPNVFNSGWERITTITTASGLTSNRVYSSYTDFKNRKWFGTGEGLNIIDGNTIATINEEDGLCGKKVLTIFEDKKGRYWFGMAEGEGLATYDGNKITCLKDAGQKIKSAIFTIAEDKEGKLWLGTESDGIVIWDGASFYKFNEGLPFNKNAIFSIKKDSEGLMWIGTEGHGVFVFDGKSFHNIDDKNGLSNNFVFSILEDSNKDMWFGTRFGLSILDKNKKDEILNKFKTNQPIASNESYFKTYSYEDGFLGVGCNRNAIYQSSDKSVWIGTTSRLTLSHLAKSDVKKELSKKSLVLFISRLDLFNEKINWIDLFNKKIKDLKLNNGINIQSQEFSGLTPWYNIPKEISLKHDNNYLTFYFTAISQDQPWKVRYQHKIDEMDADWSAWNTDNTAHYSHLHPGSYTLMVRAKDHEGNLSETIKYTFEIRNPWWLSWWMKIFYLMGIAIFGYFIHINQKNKTIKNERLRSQAKELEQAKEIEKAYAELQTTQQQLIQSEKMASLGELTAGIAHEIQNPLNFVNNFSELNIELLKELTEEIDKGDLEEVKIIAKDVIINEEKINHHGKRADSIVKGMLQHSRTNTGKKELIDINQLCSEYLGLAYHGLRAKDNSFNSSIETDFDENLPRIEVVFQDIGRVILNITTNALYAVREKSKIDGEKYSPWIKVSTKKVNNNVEISIQDNGPGIPDSIKSKIFQPFFTTKPTGQGTGLGLSMVYDIVKVHGGEIILESKEGEREAGSNFIISLPIYG